MSGARVGLLSGPVGVGKTTIAERVAGLALRQGLICGGLLAPAIMNRCGQKAGIWGMDLRTGERRVLARTDRDLGGPAVGPYSFDGAALAWALDVIETAIVGRPEQDLPACDLVFVDEIGKLELWRGTGLAPVLDRLAAGEVDRSLVLVRDSLLPELQARLEPVPQSVYRASHDNRGALAPRIVEDLLSV